MCVKSIKHISQCVLQVVLLFLKTKIMKVYLIIMFLFDKNIMMSYIFMICLCSHNMSLPLKGNFEIIVKSKF